MMNPAVTRKKLPEIFVSFFRQRLIAIPNANAEKTADLAAASNPEGESKLEAYDAPKNARNSNTLMQTKLKSS